MPAHHANQFKPRKHYPLYQKQHDCVNRLWGGVISMFSPFIAAFYSYIWYNSVNLREVQGMVSNIILFTAQWFTIQPDLFGRIEDEVGELGESERDFIRICTTALNSGTNILGSGPDVTPPARKWARTNRRRQEQPNRLRKHCLVSDNRPEKRETLR